MDFCFSFESAESALLTVNNLWPGNPRRGLPTSNFKNTQFLLIWSALLLTMDGNILESYQRSAGGKTTGFSKALFYYQLWRYVWVARPQRPKGTKGLQLEVGAQKASRLLVWIYLEENSSSMSDWQFHERRMSKLCITNIFCPHSMLNKRGECPFHFILSLH